MVNQLLETVQRWGKRNGFDEGQIATAQSMAWYYKAKYAGGELPDSHWARLGVRAVRNGRDLPGCGTSPKDALNFSWQGEGMGEVKDHYPGPDVLAEHKETMELVLDEFSDVKRAVIKLRVSGVQGKEVASRLKMSPGRVSQIAGEFFTKFTQG